MKKAKRRYPRGPPLLETRSKWTEHALIGLWDANRYISVTISEFACKDSLPLNIASFQLIAVPARVDKEIDRIWQIYLAKPDKYVKNVRNPFGVGSSIYERWRNMKFGILAVIPIFLMVACAPSQPYRSRPNPYGGSESATSGSSSSGTSSETRSTNSLSQDAAECERQAILAGAGGKAAAFDSCMRAKGHTTGR